MPGSPLLSVTLPMQSITVLINAFTASSSAEFSVMMPSPLKRVLAKIAMLSETSATEILFFSSPRFSRICFEVSSRCAPSSSLVLNAENGMKASRFNSNSGSLMTFVSHFDAATISSMWILPSPLVSSIVMVFSSISNPFSGQLNAVQSFLSSSSKCRMSCPDSMFTLVTPPTVENFQS